MISQPRRNSPVHAASGSMSTVPACRWLSGDPVHLYRLGLDIADSFIWDAHRPASALSS